MRNKWKILLGIFILALVFTACAKEAETYKDGYLGDAVVEEDGTFELLEGNFVAEPFDATALLGTEELIAHQNKVVSFKGMVVEAISFKNDKPGDDIYVTLSNNGASYDFCVEYYLTGTETEVYNTVCELNAGDVIDVEGFLYWYEGPNTHITSVTVIE